MSPDNREEEIHEPIGDVLARFRKGMIEPISFRWRRRGHRVVELHGTWVDRSVTPPLHGFTVTTEDGDLMELSYQEGNPVWRLERVFLE